MKIKIDLLLILIYAGLAGGGGKKNERKKMTVAEARPILEESELEK